MSRLQDKVTIITGAASGMGKEMALLFLDEGAKVVAADINQDRLDELEKEVADKGQSVATTISNIADKAQVEAMIQLAVDTYGRLDVLVNNAGIMDQMQPVGDVEDKGWNLIMDVDLTGNFYGMRAAVRQFEKQGGGVIVNVGSIAGISGGRAGAAYTAAKHGMIGITKSTAHMYAKENIRCNMICPGSTATNISESMGDMSNYSERIQDRILSGMVLNPRRAHPREIANVALFLASDESKVVNGAVITADSGWSAY
ncbi:SDR family oxidoreductase [Ruegeria sp. HKCCSP346]|uniref:SDR family NAD(P)-dependent oxidoreductase n=1 Tax=Ruegeria sp. HKCCSP346 TaxID=2794830 RepID=UPI001AE4ACFD|nr:SDR family oxidoreductase [Ruegeria sp. HKCCSP346]